MCGVLGQGTLSSLDVSDGGWVYNIIYFSLISPPPPRGAIVGERCIVFVWDLALIIILWYSPTGNKYTPK